MPTTLHDKLAAIIAEIERTGSAETQRLTVLKKWFETSDRLPAFAIWMLERITAEASPSADDAAALLDQAHNILDAAGASGNPDWTAMRVLLARCRDFQSEIRHVRSYSVRMIRDHSVLLLEMALEIVLGQAGRPADGYQLAARYCEHYGAGYGTSLNGPAKARVQAIADFVAAESPSG